MQVKKVKFFNYLSAPIFLSFLVFGIIFNINLDRLESVFYDYGLKLTANKSNLINNFVFINIDQASSDYLGDFYPYSNKIILKSIHNIIESEPAGIIILPEFRSYNLKDQKILKEVGDSLKEYVVSGGKLFFRQKIDSWGLAEIPDALSELNFYPSIFHQDSNIFGEDNVTRRAVISISGNETLEHAVAKLLNSNFEKNKILGEYYNDTADANFVLFKYSSNFINSKSEKNIPFFKTITGGDDLKNLKGKIIVLGTRFKSNSGDFKLTPFGEKISKNELFAQIAISLSSGKTVKILSKKISFFTSLIISVMMIFIVFFARPSKGIIIFIFTILSILIISYFIVWTTGLYFRVSETVLLGVITYYLCIPFRSILENKRNFMLKEEARILKEVDELKRNFVSLMSHDLKTPVAKIAGVVDVLKLENYDRKIYSELEKIDLSTGQLNDFINSILDLTKMESNNFQLNLKMVDLNKLIEKVCDSLKDQSSKNQITITRDLDILFPITIDENLTIRVINNLLENAIKYSGHGSNVMISTKDLGEKVVMIVKDNGVGIDKKDLKYIFQKFYRINNDQTPGNGLGLYLVKYFVELMRGEISVVSNRGEGTQFSVLFKNS